MPNKCQSCIHHEKVPHASAKKPCIKLGVLATATACELYVPDPTLLASAHQNVLKVMRLLFRSMRDPELQVMAMAIRGGSYLQKAGYEFGQPVYFCVGQEYVQNYFRGRIVSVSKDKQFVYVSSSLRDGDGNTMVTLMPESVLTFAKWEKRKRSLISANRVIEPKKNGRPTLYDELQMPRDEWLAYRDTLAVKPAEYVPPSLDSVPQHWLDKRRVKLFKEEAMHAITGNIKKSKKIADAKTKAKMKKTLTRGKDGSFTIERT